MYQSTTDQRARIRFGICFWTQYPVLWGEWVGEMFFLHCGFSSKRISGILWCTATVLIVRTSHRWWFCTWFNDKYVWIRWRRFWYGFLTNVLYFACAKTSYRYLQKKSGLGIRLLELKCLKSHTAYVPPSVQAFRSFVRRRHEVSTLILCSRLKSRGSIKYYLPK